MLWYLDTITSLCHLRTFTHAISSRCVSHRLSMCISSVRSMIKFLGPTELEFAAHQNEFCSDVIDILFMRFQSPQPTDTQTVIELQTTVLFPLWLFFLFSLLYSLPSFNEQYEVIIKIISSKVSSQYKRENEITSGFYSFFFVRLSYEPLAIRNEMNSHCVYPYFDACH